MHLRAISRSEVPRQAQTRISALLYLLEMWNTINQAASIINAIKGWWSDREGDPAAEE